MDYIFEVTDKSNRKIHLSKERWNEHIRPIHPNIQDPDELIYTLENPDKVLESDRDESVRWYFSFNKQKRKYLKVSVKYLNGEGYVITSHYTRKIY